MEKVAKDSLKAWLLATRPKTLAGAVIPVMIASSLAYADGKFQWLPVFVCTIFACLMQISANFINDLHDYLKGTDREDRLGPERACSQGWISPQHMKAGILITLTMACLVGSTLLFYAGWELIWVGVICVLFSYLYTTGPYPLSYNGWGDVLVLVFFGFVPVGGTYYVLTGTWTTDVTVASLICGLSVDTLLVLNNYRDREADAKSGKRTLVVRFGERFGSYLYLVLGIISALCSLFFLFRGAYGAALMPQFYLIVHLLTWYKMVRIHSGKALNTVLGETSRNMLILGLLVSIGLIMG